MVLVGICGIENSFSHRTVVLLGNRRSLTETREKQVNDLTAIFNINFVMTGFELVDFITIEQIAPVESGCMIGNPQYEDELKPGVCSGRVLPRYKDGISLPPCKEVCPRR